MKFSTIILGAFVALAAAAPAPQPEALAAEDVANAKLEARQYCSKCSNGGRTCCGPAGCVAFSC
jgi:hypothetical protein